VLATRGSSFNRIWPRIDPVPGIRIAFDFPPSFLPLPKARMLRATTQRSQSALPPVVRHNVFSRTQFQVTDLR
jgi:hypothetical protein